MLVPTFRSARTSLPRPAMPSHPRPGRVSGVRAGRCLIARPRDAGSHRPLWVFRPVAPSKEGGGETFVNSENEAGPLDSTSVRRLPTDPTPSAGLPRLGSAVTRCVRVGCCPWGLFRLRDGQGCVTGDGGDRTQSEQTNRLTKKDGTGNSRSGNLRVLWEVGCVGRCSAGADTRRSVFPKRTRERGCPAKAGARKDAR